MRIAATILLASTLGCSALAAGPMQQVQHYPWFGDRDRPGSIQVNPGPQTTDPLARTGTYVCEDLSTVTLTEGSPNAVVMTNSGLELGLARERGGGRTIRFGGSTHEFVVRGEDAMWYVGGKSFRCRLK